MQTAFVAVVQSSFVTMMAVGDDEFLLFHHLLDGGGAAGIGDGPKPMHDVVFIAQQHFGGGRALNVRQNSIDTLLRVGVQHKELARVRAGVAKEFKAIGFGTGERVLVAEDDTGGVVLKLAGADETATRALLARSGNSVLLGVSVKRWGGILFDDVFADPTFERGSGAGIDVVLRSIRGIGTASLNDD